MSTYAPSAFSHDLLEERLARRLAAEEAFDELLGRGLPALRQDVVAIAAPVDGVHQLAVEARQHVEREHLAPHVAVVARGVAAHQVSEGRGEHRARIRAERL